MKRTKPVFLGAVGLAASLAGAVDLGSYKGCPASDNQFTRTTLVAKGTTDSTANGPLKMDFDLKPGNVVDVYFVEKAGKLKKYDGASNKVSVVGTLPVATGNEDGLVGIVLHPDFKANRYLFLFYSFNGTGESTYRLSRFKLAGNGTLDMATEKILLKIPSTRGKWHTAGAMVFDAYQDLWLAVGDNETLEPGPGNTSDLRGGILRIHPDESAQGFSIPAKNFWEVIAGRLRTAGNTALAAQYEDPAKVRREIYVKGTRNAYTISVDPVRRWLSWGDVGPDQGKVSEEHNLVKEPYYMGWPYFAGEHNMAGIGLYGSGVPAGPHNRAAPVNNMANLQGVRELPPNREPFFVRQQGCAMTGPIFRYDGSNPSPHQFPPHFDRKWMISGCDGYGFHLVTVDDNLTAPSQNLTIFASLPRNTLVDLKQGPDGALYYVNYGAGIDVIRYTGTCKDPALIPEKPTVSVASRAPEAYWLRLESGELSILAPGVHTVEVMDLSGRVVMEFSGTGEKRYALESVGGPGVYQVKVTTPSGIAYKRLTRFAGF